MVVVAGVVVDVEAELDVEELVLSPEHAANASATSSGTVSGSSRRALSSCWYSSNDIDAVMRPYAHRQTSSGNALPVAGWAHARTEVASVSLPKSVGFEAAQPVSAHVTAMAAAANGTTLTGATVATGRRPSGHHDAWPTGCRSSS